MDVKMFIINKEAFTDCRVTVIECVHIEPTIVSTRSAMMQNLTVHLLELVGENLAVSTCDDLLFVCENCRTVPINLAAQQ